MDFDQKAKNWDNDPARIERSKKFASEIINYMGNRKPDHALEFGSGTGLVSFELKDNFKNITLADTSKGMIEVLSGKIIKENIHNMHPLLTDIFNDNHLKPGFDAIYTLLTLHHIKDINGTFKAFNRLLKKDGFVCVGDLITEDGSFHFRDPEFDGHKGFDPEEMKKVMISNGFDIRTEKIFIVIEREVRGEAKKYPLFLIIGKKS